ncbi:hypothetical protein PRIPAC_91234 [Pristionchus pacificus]|uniref:Uncharacterized protein n=1 Tax=Pristionchus pacificus TaxID=54126 RepID=A0A2A6CVA0_PRIPA|nr:hypothetical protein PRIPAC_91234 [Pristionchus pacificus]|eukprot:PDM82089.1 hypothetical protein PRIPAC_36482 [Pristionchus pacificus]
MHLAFRALEFDRKSTCDLYPFNADRIDQPPAILTPPEKIRWWKESKKRLYDLLHHMMRNALRGVYRCESSSGVERIDCLLITPSSLIIHNGRGSIDWMSSWLRDNGGMSNSCCKDNGWRRSMLIEMNGTPSDVFLSFDPIPYRFQFPLTTNCIQANTRARVNKDITRPKSMKKGPFKAFRKSGHGLREIIAGPIFNNYRHGTPMHELFDSNTAKFIAWMANVESKDRPRCADILAHIFLDN